MFRLAGGISAPTIGPIAGSARPTRGRWADRPNIGDHGRVTRRVVVAALSVPRWSPPGTAPDVWRRALADDAVDLLALMEQVDPALAVAADEKEFAASVAWPGM